jgi:flagellar basal body-associated protein FliL
MNKPLVVDFAKEAGMRLLQVNVSLAIKGSDDELKELKKHEPMIRNYFLMIIRSQEPEKLRHSEGKTALQVALLKETNKMMEKVKVKTKIENVFFYFFCYAITMATADLLSQDEIDALLHGVDDGDVVKQRQMKKGG